MEMFDIRSVCSIRTMCGIVCLWLGLSLMQLPFTSALADQTKAGVPPKVIGSGPNCTNVRSLFESRGINSNDVPSEAINDMVPRYCEPSSGTCCTYSMETKLAGLSRMQLEKNTKESIGKLASVLATRAIKFNDFFKDLLAESKKEFHAMFKRTYGVIYEQNSYVFSDLFNELENYYIRGKVDLSEAMDSFFNTLYQKMFTVLNSQYTFDDKYLGCVSEHMKELKPFGDVPDKLSVQIKRSFVATRTYEQALAAAADVAKNMINVRPGADCTVALTKMQQCGACKGFTEKPCSNYCVNVMKGCLHYYNEIDAEWDNFVQSMEKVSERLLGPFNIVMVVEPINIKISEAIMNFQETGQDISQQVFHGCGRPQLGRRRRAISSKFFTSEVKYFDEIDGDSDNFSFDESEAAKSGESDRVKRTAEPANRELQFEPLHFSNKDDADSSNNNNGNNKGRRKNNKKKPQMSVKSDDETDENKEPVLDKLVKDIRQKVKDSKKFWSNLPFQICNHEDFSVPPGIEANCWNGYTIDRYPHSIVTDQGTNPEFTSTVGPPRQSSLIAGQLFALRNAVGHLRNAYNGLDVEWTDVEEPYYGGSGSGSGAGDDDDDDDSGSGLSPYDYHPRMPDHTDINNVGINTIPGSNSGVTNGTKEIGHGDNHPSSTDGTDDGDSSSTTRIPPMSFQRALLTYFFPVYMAWFGRIFCELL
ncbi:glypican-4 [Bradysia coprophila]|uniref:glypican-4 n=1 Tax=Bradysia coprophila TaxID=38358 RepID=UPI00187D8DC6|nr:glypican-4 [Bradysia coprophila]